MLEKINIKNIIYSVYLGLFIGGGIQLYYGQHKHITLFMLVLLISGVIGLIIGTVTEFFTTMLPISIASTNKYYIFNNMIAIIVIFLVLGSISQFIDVTKYPHNSIKMVIFICSVIFICNLIVYVKHRRINKMLENFKK